MSSRKFDRKSLKDELLKRTEESAGRTEGETFAKYFRDDVDLIMARFGSTKEDPHIIDILPFRAGDKMPNFMKVAEGKPAYYLDIYVHQNIGASKAWIVCPSRNYGEPCPICEYIDELVRDGKEWDDYADIAPKRRCAYNIINQTTSKERNKGIQIWEASYKYSEKQIQQAAKNPRGGGSIAFAHPDKDVGQSISFNVDSDTFKTISGHKLIPREEDISDSLLDEVYQLDQIIKILTYKEIEKLFSRSSSEKDKKEDDIDDSIMERGAHGKSKSNECPAGEEFGVSIDQIKECEDCEVYRECADRAEVLEEEKRKQRLANRRKIN